MNWATKQKLIFEKNNSVTKLIEKRKDDFTNLKIVFIKFWNLNKGSGSIN